MHDALRKVITFGFSSAVRRSSPPTATELAADEAPLGVAVLVTKDAGSLDWAGRWLGHSGFAVTTADNGESMQRRIGKAKPVAVFVDTAMRDASGCRLFDIALDTVIEGTVVFVLCTNPQEVREASTDDRAEIIRKPFDWELIASRAARAVEIRRMERQLRDTQTRLQVAQESAADARRHLSTMTGLDILTRLPGRERFRTLAQRTIAAAGEGGTTGMLVMGLDRFRLVNEAVGHEAGNQVLSQFAERLRAHLQDRALVGGDAGTTLTAAAGRISGMRFAIVLSQADEAALIRLRDAIRADLDNPFEVDGQSIYLSMTIGSAFFPTGATNADHLLHCAEHALQKAKATGSKFRFFNSAAGVMGRQVLNMDGMLREALARHELTLAYQPIMDRTGKRVVAAEALLRWYHPEKGEIPPMEFVPVAERTGLMVLIGHSVIRQAVRQLRVWIDAGFRPVRVAVNLSLCQLMDGDIVNVIKEALGNHRIGPSLLELELSERGVLNEGEDVIGIIERLKELGVRISIDDFGAGNAAISYLKDLPADVIKIDRAYVSGPERSSRDLAIGAGMVAMAKRLDALVIAEGIETKEQFELVQEWGCDELQGYYFAKAMKPDELAKHLTRRRDPKADRTSESGSFTGIFRPILRTESLPET